MTEIGVKLFNMVRDIGYITHYIGHNFQDENVKVKGHQVSLHDAALARQETAVHGARDGAFYGNVRHSSLY